MGYIPPHGVPFSTSHEGRLLTSMKPTLTAMATLPNRFHLGPRVRNQIFPFPGTSLIRLLKGGRSLCES